VYPTPFYELIHEFEQRSIECALLQKIKKGTKIIPVYCAQMEEKDKFKPFDLEAARKKDFLDKPHVRGDHAQAVVDKLKYLSFYSPFFLLFYLSYKC
jgi:hypothetical protein